MNTNTKRAKLGFIWEEHVFNYFKEQGNNCIKVREWYKKLNPDVTDHELNRAEQKYGDILIVDNGKYIFLECVSVNQEKSIFPMSKEINFNGSNRFYAFGVDDGKIRLIHSKTWNAYIGKTPIKVIGERKYRMFSRRNVKGLIKQEIL